MAKPASGTRSIPSLDGLRALSILLVVLSHAAIAGGPQLSSLVHRYVDWGVFGVRVFFVISGYLITRLLLDELTKTEELNLTRFYFRRTFRIFPPFYLYLAVLGVLAGAGTIELATRELFVSSMYATNYQHVGWFVGHSWSLAVEEQFYLIWPVVLLWLGRRRGWIAPLVVIAICPLLRVVYFEYSGRTGLPEHQFEFTADMLAIGCLAAFGEGLFVRGLRRLGLANDATGAVDAVVVMSVLVAVAASSLRDHPRLDMLAGRTVAASAVCVAVLCLIHAPNTLIGRALNWSPLASVGRISYSLYLWQQLFLSPMGAAGLGLPIWAGVPLAFGVAYLSYRFIEQPMIANRERIGAAGLAWAANLRRSLGSPSTTRG